MNPPEVIVHRPLYGRLRITMPYFRGTRFWLRAVCGTGIRPECDRAGRVWEVARHHLPVVIAALTRRFGAVTGRGSTAARTAPSERITTATNADTSNRARAVRATARKKVPAKIGITQR